MYSNEPDYPYTVVANDRLKIVTQIWDSNYILFKWMRYTWWHPNLTNTELESKKKRRTHIGLFPVQDLVESWNQKQKWYKQYVEIRKKNV